MSKAGNNYYYLQDELGSPMYMTGTDGVAVSSYAFDDFGRNIDPRTGKQKKHGYTTDGNIIQPFAFTGYQEDEVSGLKFAQARFYDANTGRFQSEDNVKGFIESPFTLNHYGYCWGNPVGLVDRDGNLPNPIAAVQSGFDKAKTAASDALDNVKEWYVENEDTIKEVAKVTATVAVVAGAAAITVATGGAAAAVIGGAVAGGALEVASEAIDNKIDGKNVWDLSNYNLTDICIATGAGAITGGMASSLGAAVKGGKMHKRTARLIDTVGTTTVSMGVNMLSNYVENPNISKNELITEGLIAGTISLGLQSMGRHLGRTSIVRRGGAFIRRINNYGYEVAKYYDGFILESLKGFSIEALTFLLHNSIRAGYAVGSNWIENKLNDGIDSLDDILFSRRKMAICGQ